MGVGGGTEHAARAESKRPEQTTPRERQRRDVYPLLTELPFVFKFVFHQPGFSSQSASFRFLFLVLFLTLYLNLTLELLGEVQQECFDLPSGRCCHAISFLVGPNENLCGEKSVRCCLGA